MLLHLELATLFLALSPLSSQALPGGYPSQTVLSQAALSDILLRGLPILGASLFLPLTYPIKLIQSYVGPDDGCSKTLKTCDWMAKVPDNTPLVRMNLPGTHDTSTCPSLPSLPSSCIANLVYRELLSCNTSFSHSVHGPVSFRVPRSLFLLCSSPPGSLPSADTFRCQERSLLQSLNDGIRVFDLRFAYNPGNDTIGFYHCKTFPSFPYSGLTYV